jgi:hypothetical protein
VKSHGRESLERWAICGGIRCLDTRQTFGAISSVPPLSHSVKARRVLRLSGSGLDHRSNLLRMISSRLHSVCRLTVVKYRIRRIICSTPCLAHTLGSTTRRQSPFVPRGPASRPRRAQLNAHPRALIQRTSIAPPWSLLHMHSDCPNWALIFAQSSATKQFVVVLRIASLSSSTSSYLPR